MFYYAVLLLLLLLARSSSSSVCEDYNERCSGLKFSGPNRVNVSSTVSYWSDNGYCGGIGGMDEIRKICPKSCGTCVSTCEDSSEKCAEYLDLYPDVCSCAMNNSDTKATCEGKVVNGIGLLWMRNNCARSCYSKGYISGICKTKSTACAIPFIVNGKTFDRPIAVSVFKPRGYDDLQKALNRTQNSTDLWCPRDSVYNHQTSEIVYNTNITIQQPRACPDPLAAVLYKRLSECGQHLKTCDLSDLVFNRSITLCYPIELRTTETVFPNNTRIRCADDMVAELFSNTNATLRSLVISDCTRGVFKTNGTLTLENVRFENISNTPIVRVVDSRTRVRFRDVYFDNISAPAYRLDTVNDGRYASLRMENVTVQNASGSVVYVTPPSKFGEFSLEVRDSRFVSGSLSSVFWIGALYNSTGMFVNSTFDRNSADFGSVLYLRGLEEDLSEAYSIYEPNIFTFLHSDIIRNTANFVAGAIYVEQNLINRVRLIGSRLYGNESPDGAVVYVVRNSNRNAIFPTLDIDSCVFSSNAAVANGGAIYAQGFTYVRVNNSTFINNTAQYGAVISLPEVGRLMNSRLEILGGSVFENNRADDFGGSIYLMTNHVTNIQGTRFTNNTAGIDGGAIHAAGTTHIESSEFSGNRAGRDGGAMRSIGVILLSSSVVSRNRAGRFGGGVSSTLSTSAAETRFEENEAVEAGGAVYGSFSSSAVIFSGNRAGRVGAALASITTSSVLNILNGSVFERNRMSVPGVGIGEAIGYIVVVGAHATTPVALLNIDDSVVVHDSNGIGFDTPDRPMFYSYLRDRGWNVTTNPWGVRLSVTSVQAPPGSRLSLYADILDGFGQVVSIPSDMTLTLRAYNNTYTGSMQTRINLTGIEVRGRVGETFNITIRPDPLLHSVGYYAGRDAFVANITVTLTECAAGRVFLLGGCVDSNLLAPVGHWLPDPVHNLSNVQLCASGTHRPLTAPALSCIPCEAGYVSTPDRAQCNYCETIVSMSWNTSREKCDRCPDGADCYGGGQVSPKVGYYHSSKFSYQFHECLSRSACEYPGRTERLLSLTADNIKTYLNAQCAEGYRGPLCGSCDDGFQRSGATECRRCASLASNVSFFTFTFLILIAFLVYTVNGALQKEPSGTASLTMKMMVSFVQQVSALSTFRVGWPDVVTGMSSFATGSTSADMRSLGCMYNTIPTFVLEALVVIYIIPAALTLVVPIVMAVLKRCRCFKDRVQTITRDNIVTMMIIIYFFIFPFVVTTTVKLFSCVAIDKDIPDQDSYLSYAALRDGSFLMIDTKQECYVPGSWHSMSTYSIAIPSLIVFVIGLPSALGVFMFRNRGNFDDPDFLRRYGFVYAGLKHSRWWWFFIGLTRTSVIACIGMLVYNAGYQILVAQGWIVLFIIFCFSVKPYVSKKVFLMEIMSVSCIMVLLYLNLWMRFTFFEYNYALGILCVTAVALTGAGLMWMTVTDKEVLEKLTKMAKSTRNLM